jgi:energy-coupling factor transporter ATP-binding protein EcfA2
MKIQKFSFSHHRENWHIDEVSFDDFNLLVGPSGVGKTRILVALETIFGVALGRKKLDDFEWTIDFSHLGKSYTWFLKSAIPENEDIFALESKRFEVIEERLIQLENTEIFHITSSSSKLNNVKLPKIKKTESAISLFPEEDLIISLIQGFESILSSKPLNQSIQPENEKLILQTLSQTLSFIEDRLESNIESMESFKNDIQNLNSTTFNNGIREIEENIRDIEELFKRKIAFFSPNIRAFILFCLKSKLKKDDNNDNTPDFFYDGFNDIMESYLNIFPEIKDIKMTSETISNDEALIFCEIQDTDSEEWIPQNRMSSGMFRTLMYIIEVITAPEGSVILIDEFENSLGINCMSEITDFILDHADGLQFIITSHHPYIINNIPWQDWQIVSRKGSHITTKKATEISALNTASSLDKFTQLINVLDFEEMEA